jgi:putative N-acetyltransferase (TIGR04045 family)
MTATDVPIRWVSGAEELRGALMLREEVFCGEQGVPRSEEIDHLDDQAEHLVALEPVAGSVIGTLRLLAGEETARVGRVAVVREWRRRGIALRMLEMALDRARALGCRRARLAAQVDAIELYRRVGFAVESEVFQEAGIDHVWMGRELITDARGASLSG